MRKRTGVWLLIILVLVCAGTIVFYSPVIFPSKHAKVPEAAAPRIDNEAGKETAVQKPASKLKKLYDRYKHVEKVYLRDGSIFFGVMHEKDNVIDFITPDGTLNLPKTELIRVEYLNPENL